MFGGVGTTRASFDGATRITDVSGATLTTDQLAEVLSRNPEANLRAVGSDAGTGIYASTIELLVSTSAAAK